MSEKSLTPVKDILQDIRRKIMAWEYPPKHQLVEEGLCEQYKTSRSPIRQVLSQLEGEGLVQKIVRKGYFVRQPALKDIEALYDFRFALEHHVVTGLVKQGMAETTYQYLFNTWSNVTSASWSEAQLAKMDEDFHFTLAKSYGNPLINAELKIIGERLFVFREIDFHREGRLLDTQREHLTILRLILSKDEEALEKALRKNIFSGLGNVETSLAQLIAKLYDSY